MLDSQNCLAFGTINKVPQEKEALGTLFMSPDSNLFQTRVFLHTHFLTNPLPHNLMNLVYKSPA